MPSDDSTVATQADFVPMAVGNTDRVRSVVSASAHDGFSHQPRSGMQQRQLNVLRTQHRQTICPHGTIIDNMHRWVQLIWTGALRCIAAARSQLPIDIFTSRPAVQ